ncbi:YybH family protein [Micromonospora sp. NPDC004336]
MPDPTNPPDPTNRAESTRRPAPATSPEDLGRLFVARANAGDVDGLVALYEPDAVLATPAGPAVGTRAVRAALTALLADRPTFTPGQPQPTLRAGDLALTSTRLDGGGVTVEVARRRPDGTWRWVIDQPRAAG